MSGKASRKSTDFKTVLIVITKTSIHNIIALISPVHARLRAAESLFQETHHFPSVS